MKYETLPSFPCWAYSQEGAVMFKTAEAFAEASTEQDWYDSPIHVPKATLEVVYDRDKLLAQAEAKGLKVDGRWSDKRLADELAKE